MELLTQFIDLFLHLDKHLDALVRDYGVWTYLILFAIIFFETGVVLTPFLPGDSLLFAAGVMAGRETLNPHLLFALLTAAAVLGDTANYWIGRGLGPQALRLHSRVFRPEHIERTHAFFERYGGKTIIIARFVPIVRTFAPFVAGIGAMTYNRFIIYNVVGGALWVALCVYGGYFFGGLPVVKENFTLVVLGIIAVSLLPGVFEYLRHRRARTANLSRAAENEGA